MRTWVFWLPGRPDLGQPWGRSAVRGEKPPGRGGAALASPWLPGGAGSTESGQNGPAFIPGIRPAVREGPAAPPQGPQTDFWGLETLARSPERDAPSTPKTHPRFLLSWGRALTDRPGGGGGSRGRGEGGARAEERAPIHSDSAVGRGGGLTPPSCPLNPPPVRKFLSGC